MLGRGASSYSKYAGLFLICTFIEKWIKCNYSADVLLGHSKNAAWHFRAMTAKSCPKNKLLTHNKQYSIHSLCVVYPPPPLQRDNHRPTFSFPRLLCFPSGTAGSLTARTEETTSHQLLLGTSGLLSDYRLRFSKSIFVRILWLWPLNSAPLDACEVADLGCLLQECL